MNKEEFKTLVDQLAKEWGESGGYDKYNSILEFLDESFDRNFYLSLNPSFLIHEVMRNELGFCCDENFVNHREIILSGLMECYDFCWQTKDMTEDERANFIQFND